MPELYPVWAATEFNEIARINAKKSNMTGFAGVIFNGNGLGVRVETGANGANIAAARKVIRPNDNKFNDINRHVIPKLFFEIQGTPLGTEPGAIIKLLAKADALVHWTPWLVIPRSVAAVSGFQV